MADSGKKSILSRLKGFWNNLMSLPGFNSPESPHRTAEEGRQTREGPLGEASDDIENKLIDYTKYDGVPGGWPEFSHQQHYQHNRSIHRRFGPLNQRLILDYEVQLHSLESELHDLDETDAKEMPDILRGLPHDQRPTDEKALDRMARRKAIMGKLHDIYPKYQKLLLMDSKMRELPRISRLEQKDFIRKVTQDNIVDEPARKVYYHVDDCITTRRDRDHESFEWLVYKNDWFYGFLRKRFLSKRYPDGRRYINRDRLKMISISVTIILPLALLLPPMLILLLVPFENWQSALVVVLFAIIAAAGMALHDVKPERVFLAMSAYMAVLVTFLLNFQGGGQCQCVM